MTFLAISHTQFSGKEKKSHEEIVDYRTIDKKLVYKL